MNMLSVLPDGYWSELLKKRFKGEVSHDEIVRQVRELHMPNYTAMLTRWMEGTLFYSQKASFENWLGIPLDVYAVEVEAANEYLGFECGVSEKENEDIHAFILYRIWKPSFGKRKEISENLSKKEIAKDFWRKQNVKYRWDWV